MDPEERKWDAFWRAGERAADRHLKQQMTWLVPVLVAAAVLAMLPVLGMVCSLQRPPEAPAPKVMTREVVSSGPRDYMGGGAERAKAAPPAAVRPRPKVPRVPGS